MVMHQILWADAPSHYAEFLDKLQKGLSWHHWGS